MDNRIYQTNPGKIGLYVFSERKIVLALPAPSIPLPYDNGQETPSGKKYEIEVARPKRQIQIRLPQSQELIEKSVFRNVQYQAYQKAQMLDEQEIWHFVDILV